MVRQQSMIENSGDPARMLERKGLRESVGKFVYKRNPELSAPNEGAIHTYECGGMKR